MGKQRKIKQKAHVKTNLKTTNQIIYFLHGKKLQCCKRKIKLVSQNEPLKQSNYDEIKKNAFCQTPCPSGPQNILSELGAFT